jgi:hypothetical protein
MNCRYFACPNCRLYIDAGYRWAYELIEHTGVVRLGEGVDVDSLLGTVEYWNPPEGERSEWLCRQILPSVRNFLNEHQAHGIVYIEEDHIHEEESIYYNWCEVK